MNRNARDGKQTTWVILGAFTAAADFAQVISYYLGAH